jgi:hypothetical protein
MARHYELICICTFFEIENIFSPFNTFTWRLFLMVSFLFQLLNTDKLYSHTDCKTICFCCELYRSCNYYLVFILFFGALRICSSIIASVVLLIYVLLYPLQHTFIHRLIHPFMSTVIASSQHFIENLSNTTSSSQSYSVCWSFQPGHSWIYWLSLTDTTQQSTTYTITILNQ